MAHLRLNLAGLKGPACQATVERALREIPGVWAAVVCLDQGYADVEYADDGPGLDALIAAVRAAGYAARIGG